MLLALLDPLWGVAASSDYGILEGSRVFKVKGINGLVTVVFDEDGVAHIYAKNEEDAYYAVGFIHAWTRLWEMDIQRRLASGRLAEVIGRDALKNDIYMRIIGLRRSAEATTAWIKENEPKVYKALEAYSSGVNEAIRVLEKSHRLPLMFKLLGYKPEPWTPVDSIVWAKYMAWSLTNFWEPLILSYLYVKLGSDVNILWPVHPYYHEEVTVVPGNGSINGKSLSVDPSYLKSLNWFEEWATGLNFSDPNLASKVEEAVRDILELVGATPWKLPELTGSNNWAVAPKRSLNGHAMMADDPHLPLNMPSLWFFVHVKTEDGLEVFGATLLGIPFAIIGYNKYISWGLTNTEIGVMDFYVEKVNPKDPTLYYFKGRWLKMKQVVEEIKVKGEGVYRLLVNITVHGPVLTTKGLVVSFKWTGNAGFKDDGSGVTREAVAIYYVNHARNLTEFLRALRYWDVPSQNFMYADVYGNIAVIEPGLFPLRKVKLPNGQEVLVIGSKSLLNGTGDYEWVGYVPFELVPHSINPKRGFLAAPNQMSVGPYYPYFILGTWWSPSARAHAIFMHLTSKEKHGVKDMMAYQASTFDWYAYMNLPILINAVKSIAGGVELEALRILEQWDYRDVKDSVAPTLWWAWFSALQDEMYAKYLRSHGIEERFYPPPDTTTWLVRHHDNPLYSKWFPGGFNQTVYKALKRALMYLKEHLGDDIEKWVWGRVHRLYLKHLSGLEPLTRGPYPEDGGPHVLMAAGIPYDLRVIERDVTVRTGPSLRIITVMAKGTCEVYWVYPGGQSGNPLSPHYDDLFEYWYNYKYRKYTCPESPREVKSIGTITLKP